MADTPNLALALLKGAQSQKHVTVNEALIRMGLPSTRALAERILPLVRSHVATTKRSPEASDLERFYTMATTGHEISVAYV